MTHEYGHYVNYRMWGGGDGPLYDADLQLLEGWAIFYSFAARNYANDAYGDALREDDDNTETSPFLTGTGRDGNQYRFIITRYAYGGKPSYAAFGCYVWSLYDGYGGGPFEASEYDPGDNDDVNGYARRVFEIFRTKQKESASGYNKAFKNGLSSLKKTATQRIYDFMTADYTEVPDTPMGSPQAARLKGDPESGSVHLQWDERSYSSGLDYDNYEAGYRIYKDGSRVATVSGSTTEYSYTKSDPGGRYTVTAYNAAGQSLSPPAQQVGVSVSISGPTFLSSGETGTWTADASGGEGSYSYEWYEKKESDYSFSPVKTIGDSYTSTYYEDVTLKVVASADHTSDVDYHDVTVGTVCEYDCFSKATRLAQFEGEMTGSGTATLTWTVAEPPAAGFEVQRASGSSGQATWTTVGTVTESAKADGAYRFTDGDLPHAAETLRYRLRLPGSEEAASVSEPITVVREAVSDVALTGTFPNPASEQVTVQYAVPDDAGGEAHLSLYDLMGRKVRTVTVKSARGRERAQLNVSGLSSGVYVPRLRAGGTVTSERLTVAR